MTFKGWNRVVGWSVFAIALLTYLLTMEPVASLWDCSEFIATSYKLEVGHPPGAPLFMLLARIAAIFAPSAEYVPHMVNGMNCLASAFCILFLFWTITHIARRIAMQGQSVMTTATRIAILGAGAVGALAYTFTDTFWFSAVEGEVYALSSMFTALVVWLMLKWEEHADEPGANRWILLIAYLMGLSIGVHILNLLTIPALVFIYYFRKHYKSDRVNFLGMVIATLCALLILGVINGIIIPYTVYIGAMIDLFFVNVIGAPVNSGIIFYALLVLGGLSYLIFITHKHKLRLLNFITLCLTMILIGFSSYATVTIRAAANPPMNSNNPDNPHALLALLNRDQYGNRPLLYGPQVTFIEEIDQKTGEKKLVPYSAAKGVTEDETYSYNPETGKYDVVKKLVDYDYYSESMSFFPRMWNTTKANEYMVWGAYREEEITRRDQDGNIQQETVKVFGKQVDNPIFTHNIERYEDTPRKIIEPTFGENLNFFFKYQLGYMYGRYFMWNFVGRQDDIQAGEETLLHGNWISGIEWMDSARLGPQDNLPKEMQNNPARNTYFYLPLLLGLFGMLYQLLRDGRYFIVVLTLFVMMGIALVVYFNTGPSEPRERDYVYAGSFYAFCIWIGLGVLTLRDFISVVFKHRATVATSVCATLLGLGIPTILAAQNWDDHDRSGRTYAHDIGWNYLASTPKNAIIINYGDNDTFPLWYAQEVEEFRPDVRIMNSSYLSGDWYIDQMKQAANKAQGVPFSLPRSKYVGDENNHLYIIPPSYWGGNDDEAWYIQDAIDFVKSDEEYTKWDFGNNEKLDFLPTQHLILPVNKQNVLDAGIVKPEDEDLILDEIVFTIKKDHLLKSEMMLLDMLANFDWRRPICFTQVYVLDNLGLLDYLQFDGFSYRLVPIRTPYYSSWDIGRIDTELTYDLMMNKFRYGNLADEDVLVDYFTSYNMAASKTREGFARLAKALINEGDKDRARKVLEKGLEVYPIEKIRYSDANTIPFIESYYLLGDNQMGDKMLRDYANHLMEHLNYYLRFPAHQQELIVSEIANKENSIENLLYNVAIKHNRQSVVKTLQDQLTKYYQAAKYDPQEIPYLIAESYYYYSLNDEGDAICQRIFDKSATVIDAFSQLPEDALTTPAQEQEVVDAMITMESTYSLVKKYGREQLTQLLYTYLLSLGYNDAELQSM